jgi:hypothetical protein
MEQRKLRKTSSVNIALSTFAKQDFGGIPPLRLQGYTRELTCNNMRDLMRDDVMLRVQPTDGVGLSSQLSSPYMALQLPIIVQIMALSPPLLPPTQQGKTSLRAGNPAFGFYCFPSSAFCLFVCVLSLAHKIKIQEEQFMKVSKWYSLLLKTFFQTDKKLDHLNVHCKC